MLTARIVGAEGVISHFLSVSGKVRGNVRDSVARLTMTLLRLVKESKLSGQVLRNVTGTLRRSINQRLEEQGSSITGSVGTNLSYAAAHEFGCHDEVTVREHLRTITKAWGRELKEAVTFTVAEHAMHMNLPEKSFLRSALDDMKVEIRDELAEAMRGAL